MSSAGQFFMSPDSRAVGRHRHSEASPTWSATLSAPATAEGRSRAQKRGRHTGRPPKLTEAQKAEAHKRRAHGATLAELARSYDVGKSTISRL